jgi:hypothetical protein
MICWFKDKRPSEEVINEPRYHDDAGVKYLALGCQVTAV